MSNQEPAAPEVQELLGLMGTYLHLDDTGHILFALAVGVSARFTGSDPLWGLLVGAPSGGKTETIRALDGLAEHVDELTAAALLSWLPGKKPRPTGVLTRVGSQAFVTVGDFSTVLATSDRGGRDQLFALLRRAYDGTVTRDLGNAPEPLRWKGRMTILAGVTQAIDHYSAHSDQLGPRWLYYRLRSKSAADELQAQRKLRQHRSQLDEYRAKVRTLATEAVRKAIERPPVELSDDAAAALFDYAYVACHGRGAVPRNGYGRREIEGMAVVEATPRLTGQLFQLAQGLLALGLTEDAVLALCHRTALDSMPEIRREVLVHLSRVPQLTASELARMIGCDRKPARMALEDLAAIGLTDTEDEDESDPPERFPLPKPWWLAGEDTARVRRVLTARPWDEKWGPPPQPPQQIPFNGDTPHTSSQGKPDEDGQATLECP